MPQLHPFQEGVFLVTTNAQDRIPWLTRTGVRHLLIDNLCVTRNLCTARLYAFCILPNHMHIVVNPGPKGISNFMHSFKRNSSKDIGYFFRDCSGNRTRAGQNNNDPSRGSVTPALAIPTFTGWQNGFHARRLEDGHALTAAIKYVQYNPSRHGLTELSQDWPGTSLQYPDLIDSTEW